MRRISPDDLTPLLEDLAEHATAWEFFALGRAVEQTWPDAPRIGTSLDPTQERMELAHAPTIDFPRTTIAGFEAGERRPKVRSLHLGLTGPMGPLPLHMTEITMLEASGTGAKPVGDFLDMISARMLQAYYRAWASANPCAQADRPRDDDFAGFVGAISGSTSLRFVSGAQRPDHDDTGYGDWRRLAYGGHLAALRSAAAVGDLLGHVLGRSVQVDEAVGRWRAVPADARTAIGRSGAHQRLGTGAMIGARFFAVEWDVGLRIRALSMDDLEQLLPGGDVHETLDEAVSAVLPAHLDWHAYIEIEEAAIEPARLGRARLGMTGWLSPRGHSRIRRDVRIVRRKAVKHHLKGEVA